MSKVGFATRARMNLYRRVCPVLFASFPKSGKTWTKRVLEAYCAKASGRPSGSLNFNTWSPFVPLGAWRTVPGVNFSHAVYKPGGDRTLADSVRSHHGKRVVLQARDPQAIMLGYYAQRVHHFREQAAIESSLSEFVRHDVYGIGVVVDYLNAWVAGREHYKDFLVLRYEDLAAEPAPGFSDLLEFLDVAVDASLLASAIFEVSDTTRDLEGRGTARGSDPLPELRDLLSADDAGYVAEHMQRIDPGLGYRG